MNNKFIEQYISELSEKGFYEAIGDGISIQDTNFKILYQNNVHKSFVGEHIGEYCYQAYEKKASQCEACPLSVTFKDGLTHTAEQMVPINGGISYFEITSSAIQDKTGKIIAGIEVVRDVTERKKAQKELIFRSGITEQVNAAVITTGLDFKINWVNQAFSSLYGYSSDEIIGQTPEVLNIDPLTEEIQNDIYQTVSSGEDWTGEVMNRRKDGTTFLCELNINPLKDKNGNIFAYAGHQRNITERKRAEKEQERLTAELIIKNKELEQILYVTSHDLRSPLVNVEGYSKELDYSFKEIKSLIENVDIASNLQERITSIVKEDIPESFHYIHTSVVKMNTLLDGILFLSRLGRCELIIEEINMNKMMADIVDNHRFKLKELLIRTEVSKLPNCKGDSAQINQVFSNLLDNAIKYSDPDRSIVINISGYKDKNQSVYCIDDNGIGILSEYQDKIFEIFHQLEPSRVNGQGMGLTIVHKVIEKHNGKTWVESELGKGSKFFVSLPA